MNATELFLKDHRPAAIWFCEKCRVVHRTEAEANQCCQPYKCDMCQKEIERYHTRCGACSNIVQAQKEKERFEKAEKVTEWDGVVFVEGLGHREGYFSDLSELLEWLEDEYEDNEAERPKIEYAWTCEPEFFACGSVDDITDRICDNGYEDFSADDLNGVKELKEAIDKFNEANSKICSWSPNYEKAVLLNADYPPNG